ncbi:hypothetical protein [Cohnella lubricantis]|uniref:Spore coat protein n=1 Tax=Cohnella lubricantis TaxID=2163172 RepID=A0A841TDT8_9BACL|nr:hypothetical protein [Cohnella lubricantis]MBB6678205.1 hypothetical protein [Cohnella lubricantis]MBP2120060.1 hypothetical protein [Cohnella lubricantis]
MWRWIEWGAKLLASAVLLSFLCVWTTGYIVNSYVQTVLKELEIPLDVQPFALSGVWGKLWGADERPKEASEAQDESASGGTPAQTAELPGGSSAAGPYPSGSPVPGWAQDGELDGSDDNGAAGEGVGGSNGSGGGMSSGGGTTGSAGTGAGAGAGGYRPGDGDGDAAAGSGGEAEAPGDAVPVWSEGSGSAAASDPLDEEERQKLYSIVVSKLSASQLQQLSAYLDGGLDEEEMTEVQTMLEGALNEEEYAEMMRLLQPESQTGGGPSIAP